MSSRYQSLLLILAAIILVLIVFLNASIKREMEPQKPVSPTSSPVSFVKTLLKSITKEEEKD